MIEVGHLTHRGLRRNLNEDTYHCDVARGLWLVADGMGGAESGELASALARDSVAEAIRAGRDLTDAVREANDRIVAASRSRGHALPMGTTLVAARTHGQRFEVAWVGDSRAYLWHDDRLTQLSRDHSYVQELVRQGVLDELQARSHPQRNVVTQALGVTDSSQLNVDTLSGDFRDGMQLLLCSDGLTEELDNVAIADVLLQQGISAQECVDQLVLASLEHGGRDNITVVLVRRH